MAVQLLRPGQHAAHVLDAGGKRNTKAQVGDVKARVRIDNRQSVLDVLPSLGRALISEDVNSRILGIARLIHDGRRWDIKSFYTLAAAGADKTGASIVQIKQEIAVVGRECGLTSLYGFSCVCKIESGKIAQGPQRATSCILKTKRAGLPRSSPADSSFGVRDERLPERGGGRSDGQEALSQACTHYQSSAASRTR